MTSAVHGGIHNTSRRVVGVGCVGVSIDELVVLQNGALILPHRVCLRLLIPAISVSPSDNDADVPPCACH